MNRLETVKTLAGMCKYGQQTEINAVQSLKVIAGEHSAVAIDLIENRLLKEDTWNSSVLSAIGNLVVENPDAGLEFIKRRRHIRTDKSYYTLICVAADVGVKKPDEGLQLIKELSEEYAEITAYPNNTSYAALKGLEDIIEKHPQKTPFIVGLAESPRTLHRRLVHLSLWSAARFNPQAIGPVYAKLLADPDPEVRRDARGTVIAFTEPVEEVYQKLKELADSKDVRELKAAAEGLGMHGRLHPDEALTKLEALADHSSPEVRCNALSSLGHLGGLREVKALQLLEKHNRDCEKQVLGGIASAFTRFNPKDKKRAAKIMTGLEIGIEYSTALTLANYALESDEYTDNLISYLKAKASTKIKDPLSLISTSGRLGSAWREPSEFHRKFIEIARRHPDKVYHMLSEIQETSPGRNNVYVMWTIGQLLPLHPGAPKLLLDTILNTSDASEKYWHAPQSLPILAKAQPERVLAAIKPHITDNIPTWFMQVIATTLPPNRLQKIIDDPKTPERVKTNLHQFLIEIYKEIQTQRK